jgi:hypothetical protein
MLLSPYLLLSEPIIAPAARAVKPFREKSLRHFAQKFLFTFFRILIQRAKRAASQGVLVGGALNKIHEFCINKRA